MSYLQGVSSPSFTEAIISFWFRVPVESLDSIVYDKDADPAPVFNGILPLLVIGPEGREEGHYDTNPKVVTYFTRDFISQGPFYGTHAEYLGEECNGTFVLHIGGRDLVCCAASTRTTMYTPVLYSMGEDVHDVTYRTVCSPTPHPIQKANPTCIGVDMKGHLYVNFQTARQPIITGDSGPRYLTSVTEGYDYSTSGNAGYSSGAQVTSITYVRSALGCTGLIDTSTTTGPTVVPPIEPTSSYKSPEEHYSTFPVLPFESGKVYSGGPDSEFHNSIKVSPNRWHHVLVSVKLQSTYTQNYVDPPDYGYGGGSLLYVALDDVNYTEGALSEMWDWGGPDGKLGPNEAYPDAAWDVATDYYNPDYGPPSTYTLENPEVPAGAIGIPATDSYVDNIGKVEMAELQIWFGKSIDTGEVSNRRMFVSDEGKPVGWEIPTFHLGQADIILHTSHNWRYGINTGASGYGFTPTPLDGVKPWKPDPRLGR